MKPLSQNDCRAFSSALETIYGVMSVEQFPTRVLSAVRKVFPCDVICYNEVGLPDADISWIMEPASALPSPDLRKIFQRHLLEHPVFSYYTRTGDGHSLRISDFLSQRQFHDSGLYSEFYKPSSVEYQLGTIISITPRQVIGFALDRDRSDFSENERLCLDLLRPHLVQAYRNAQTLDIMKRAVEIDQRKLVIVSRSGQVLLATDDVWQVIGDFFGVSCSQSSLPDTLNRWIRREKTRLAEDSDIPSRSTPLVVNKGNQKLMVRLLWGGKAAEQDLLILEKRAAEPKSGLLYDPNLTHREKEILAWLPQGKTNAEIGRALSISPLTVKKHLEHIYSKLNVNRRSAAVARSLQL
jgi:DNA-binding CsgD family transcriptional regulator